VLAPNRFIVFSCGRAGSSTLVSLLNSLPAVYCDSEILFHRTLFPYTHVHATCARSGAQNYGCKILTYQIRDIQPIRNRETFLNRLYNDGFKILYLKRNNLLFYALSNIRARATEFHQRKKDPLKPYIALTVHPEEVVQWIKAGESLAQYEQKLLENVSCLKLIYEEHFQSELNHQSTMDMICDYLGLNSAPVESEYRKVAPESLEEYVVNHKELSDYLQHTDYSHFLP
jgi:LPS sulfotransferase NodH